MTAKQKITMYNNIEKHGNNLNAIFHTGIEPIKLCRNLFSLEGKASRLTTLECNTGNDYSSELSKILTSVKKILFPSTFESPDLYKSIFINGDARGYALKIESSYVTEHSLKIQTDWGGYGIIAPDFTQLNFLRF